MRYFSLSLSLSLSLSQLRSLAGRPPLVLVRFAGKELDDVSVVLNPQQKDEISDSDQAKAVCDFLKASPKPEVAKDPAKKQTTVKAKSDVIVSLVELEHHSVAGAQTARKA